MNDTSGANFALINNAFTLSEIINTRYYPEFKVNSFLNTIVGSFDKNREVIREYLSKMGELGFKFEMIHLTAHFSLELLMNFQFRRSFDNLLKEPKQYNLTDMNSNQISMLIRVMDKLNLYNNSALALIEVYLEQHLYQLDIEDAIGMLHILSKYKLGSTDTIISLEKHIGLNR